MHKVFQLHDILRIDCTEVINLLINISSPKLNNQVFFISKHTVYEYVSQHLKLNCFAVANPENL